MRAIETVSSGVAGLDEVLGGGFPAYRLHLVEGGPGVGKTTLALQFLMDGAQRAEPVLYVTLSETAEELEAVARAVLIQLHELLSYLSQRGVLTLLTMAQHGLVGDRMSAPLDVSYLADTVVLLRYFESAGQLRRALSVVKKRSGAHEPTIRELRLAPPILVSEPLREFSGVLTSAPVYVGASGELLDRAGA